jgi:2-C-methyl-D-erythritol 4-phosphate cytidylyltransferase
MKVAALVLAAGRGERLGQALPKAFVQLIGRTLLEHSLAILARAPEIDLVQPVVASADLDRFAELALEGIPKLLPVVAGGAERQDSVAAGIAALGPEVGWVAVHDAARCLVTPEEVGRVVAAGKRSGAALLAIPARDTIKRVVDGVVVETPDRRECWAAQTPQVFRIGLLREALEKARADGVVGTDDSELVERLGADVEVVEGSARNLKITLPEDLALAAGWLRAEAGGAQTPEGERS